MRIIGFAIIIVFFIACLDEEGRKQAQVRLTNSTANKSITFFKYKESGKSEYGSNLINRIFNPEPSTSLSSNIISLEPGDTGYFILPTCDKYLDFQVGNLLGLFDFWEWEEKYIVCGQVLNLTVTD